MQSFIVQALKIRETSIHFNLAASLFLLLQHTVKNDDQVSSNGAT